MPIGPFVRRLFGRHERRVAELYRSVFMDLSDYARNVRRWAPEANRVLEVGCGEGAVLEELAQIFPAAEILAIDITPNAGRLYRGRRHGVEIRQTTVHEVAREHPGGFDLIVLSDVIHHVPPAMRGEIIDSIVQALAPGGRFVFKEWVRTATPIHWLGYACDRWLTGDNVAYLTPDELERLVAERAPTLRPVADGRVRPWKNNYALVFAAGTATASS